MAEPRSAASAQGLIWKDVALSGNTAHGFAEQIGALEGFLAENCAPASARRPATPSIRGRSSSPSARDHSFLLDPIMRGPAGDGGL